MKKTTESSSLYQGLDKMSTTDLLENINREDQKVSLVIEEILPSIEKCVEAVFKKMREGGHSEASTTPSLPLVPLPK